MIGETGNKKINISVGKVLSFPINLAHKICFDNDIPYVNDVSCYFLILKFLLEDKSNEYKLDDYSKSLFPNELLSNYIKEINSFDFKPVNTVFDYFIKYMDQHYTVFVVNESVKYTIEFWKNIYLKLLDDSNMTITTLSELNEEFINAIDCFKLDNNKEKLFEFVKKVRNIRTTFKNTSFNNESIIQQISKSQWGDVNTYYGIQVYDFDNPTLKEFFNYKYTGAKITNIQNIDDNIINGQKLSIINGIISSVVYDVSIVNLELNTCYDFELYCKENTLAISNAIDEIVKNNTKCNIMEELVKQGLIKPLSEYYIYIYNKINSKEYSSIEEKNKYIDISLSGFTGGFIYYIFSSVIDSGVLTKNVDHISKILFDNPINYIKERKRVFNLEYYQNEMQKLENSINSLLLK